jgi:hypothetical protein
MIVFGAELLPEERLKSKQLEEGRGHGHRADEFCGVAHHEIDAGGIAPGGHRVHAPEMVAKEQVPAARLALPLACRMSTHQLHDAIGFRVRQGPQKYGVDNAEDRRVGANAKRQRDNGSRGKPGCSPKRSQRVSRILQNAVDR